MEQNKTAVTKLEYLPDDIKLAIVATYEVFTQDMKKNKQPIFSIIDIPSRSNKTAFQSCMC